MVIAVVTLALALLITTLLYAFVVTIRKDFAPLYFAPFVVTILKDFAPLYFAPFVVTIRKTFAPLYCLICIVKLVEIIFFLILFMHDSVCYDVLWFQITTALFT